MKEYRVVGLSQSNVSTALLNMINEVYSRNYTQDDITTVDYTRVDKDNNLSDDGKYIREVNVWIKKPIDSEKDTTSIAGLDLDLMMYEFTYSDFLNAISKFKDVDILDGDSIECNFNGHNTLRQIKIYKEIVSETV